ncbi:MAG: sensor histidine kinase [Gammaproteobacteria bacterium]|nr:sensor histidine kinase [Gammaproteobacteria bacterium]
MPGTSGFTQALESMDEVVLLFDADTTALLWASTAASRLFALDTSPGTESALTWNEPALRPLRNCLQREPGPVEFELAGQAYTGKLAKIPAQSVGGSSQLLMWLKEEEVDSRHIRQYLEEREKLFTTSRTISVSEMATTLAHELNQPIGSIANILKGTQSRLQQSDCDPAILEALDRATEQTQFASRIIARIRDFTRSRQPVRTDCRIDYLLNDSIALLDWVLDSANVTVVREFPEPAPFVNVDETMLQQVFTNLIRNAVDAMRSMPETQRQLRVSVHTVNQGIRIDFTDSGSGLTNTDEGNLFVPFVTQKAHGMGVGLNICRSFVELHQGRLWLKPNPEGGCTACVVLVPVTGARDTIPGGNVDD